MTSKRINLADLTADQFAAKFNSRRKLSASAIPAGGRLELELEVERESGRNEFGTITKAVHSVVWDNGEGVSRDNAVKAVVYVGPDQPETLTVDVVEVAQRGGVAPSRGKNRPPAVVIESSQEEWADPRVSCFKVILPAGKDDGGEAYKLPAFIDLKLA